MKKTMIAVLVTVAFSAIGVLGDYFLKLSSVRDQPLRTRWFYVGFAVYASTGIRNATPKAGHHQRCLLYFHGATPHRRRRGAVRGIVELL